jgi:hypothetical protein
MVLGGGQLVRALRSQVRLVEAPEESTQLQTWVEVTCVEGAVMS